MESRPPQEIIIRTSSQSIARDDVGSDASGLLNDERAPMHINRNEYLLCVHGREDDHSGEKVIIAREDFDLRQELTDYFRDHPETHTAEEFLEFLLYNRDAIDVLPYRTVYIEDLETACTVLSCVALGQPPPRIVSNDFLEEHLLQKEDP